MKNKLPPLTFSCYMMSHEDLTTQYSMDVLIEKDIKVASCVFTITDPYPEPTITYIQTFERYQRQWCGHGHSPRASTKVWWYSVGL